VRIRLDVPNAVLRRALTDLLEDAGHVVDASPHPGAVDLQVLAEPGAAAGGTASGVATLLLRPGHGVRPAEDRVAALRAALRTGGTAVWSSPLDAEGLLDALAPAAPEGARARPPSRAAVDGAFAVAPHPWVLLDPATREVVWAVHAADGSLVVPGGRRLSEKGARTVPAAVFEREAGSEVRTIDGRPHVVVWWPDARGRRYVGVLPLPDAADARGATNLDTLAELGRMSATLAHEIRNPLASFAGALDLLGRESDPEERAGVLRLARVRLDQMKTMLNEALRLVRPLGGRPEPVSLEEVAASAVALARTDPRFEHVEMRVEVEASPSPSVLAHAEPLRQAVVNLLVNAAEAQGGRGRILVRIGAADAFGVLRVEDEGPGIPAASRERVFAPFWTTKASGTGLGLAFVKRVADAAGGRAVVEDPARGASVRLEFPSAPG
jgi:signal transduction histidine kinase